MGRRKFIARSRATYGAAAAITISDHQNIDRASLCFNLLLGRLGSCARAHPIASRIIHRILISYRSFSTGCLWQILACSIGPSAKIHTRTDVFFHRQFIIPDANLIMALLSVSFACAILVLIIFCASLNLFCATFNQTSMSSKYNSVLDQDIPIINKKFRCR